MKNVGNVDRTVRLLLVLAIVAAYLSGVISGTVALVLGAVALVLFLTGLFATCPAYMPFRISTRGRG